MTLSANIGIGTSFTIATEGGEPAYLAEAETIFAAMTSPKTNRKWKINNLVSRLKTAGVWDKGIQLLVFGADRDENVFMNWFNPGTLDGANVNATINVNRDIHGYSTANLYALSNFNPNTHLSSTDVTIGLRVTDDINESTFNFGALDGVASYIYLQSRKTNQANFAIFDKTQTFVPNTNSAKHIYISRTGTTKQIHLNKTKTTAVKATTGLPNEDVFLLANSESGVAAGWCNTGLRYWLVCEFLSDQEIADAQDAFDVYFNEILLLDEYEADTHIISIGDKTSGFIQSNSDNCDEEVLQHSPQWIIGTGDMSDDEFANQSMENMLSKYSDLHDEGKVLSAWGNHERDYDATGSDFLNYINRPKSYYSQVIGYAEFFFFDSWLKSDESGWYTTAEENLIVAKTENQWKTSTQGAWLLAQMAVSTATWKILVIHKPIWGSEDAAYLTPGMQWDWASYGISLILQGHKHHYERIEKDTGSGNVTIVTNGSTGALQVGFGAVDVDSVIRLESGTDSDLSSGFFLDLEITATSIYGNMHGVENSEQHTAGKDTFTIT